LAPDHEPDEHIRAGRTEDEQGERAESAGGEPVADDRPVGEQGDAVTGEAAPPGQDPVDGGWADVDARTTWDDADEPADDAVPAARAAAAGPARRPPGRRPPARRPGPPRGRGRPPTGAPTARPHRPPGRGRPAPPPAPAAPNRGGTVAVLTVLTLVVVALAVGGVALARSAKKKNPAAPAAQPTTTLVTLPDSAFVTYQDAETGFTIRYPRGWHRSEAPLREIRLQVSDDKQYSCRVQVRHTEEATTPANLGNLQQTMIGFIGPDVQIVKQDPVTVNGLIGFRFIYRFTDSTSGLEGAHLHYFLFQGHKMNSIVFEAVPTGDFSRIEGVFDQMLQSFHSDPEPTTQTTGSVATGPPTTG
jgi:hypothetical protein